MDSLFKSYEDDMKKSLQSLESLITSIQSSNDKESKQLLIKKVDTLIKTIEEDMECMEMEAGNLNKSITSYKERFISSKTKFRQLKGRIDHQNNMDDLMEGGSSPNIIMGDQSTRDRVQKCIKTMENGTKMLKQSIAQVQEDIVLARNINMELAAQGERLRGFEKRFDNIDAELNQSDKTMKKMERRWFF